MKLDNGMTKPVAAICLVALSMLPTASAFFRMNCDGPLVRDRADPIVNPGAPSGHLHTIVGGNAFDFSMSGEKAHTATCTSCIVSQDKSNYWVPDLWVKGKNNKFHPVSHRGMTVYYLQRNGPQKDQIVPFPDDFRMLAGDPNLRSYSDTEAQNAVTYACLGNGGPQTNNIPNKQCPSGLRAQVFFPSCWDGKNSDSPDHKSHVAYPIGGENGPCPSTHPKRLMSLFFEVLFSIKEWDSEWVGGKHPFVFSNGDPTGYGFHGDFINGWDPATLKEAIKCENDSGRVEDCHVLKLNSHEDRENCKIAPRIDEPTEGWLDALPGCNPVQAGPQAAIVPPKCNVVSSIGAPKSYSSDMSSKGWSYVGCAYDDLGKRVLPNEKTYADDMTIEKCIDHCSSKGYSHAGLQWTTECFCGNSVDKSALGSVQCTMPCGGNDSQYCGGSQKLSIYRKGTNEPVPKPAATSTTKAQPTTTQKAPSKPTTTTTANTQPTKVVVPKPDSEGSGPKPDPTPAAPTPTTPTCGKDPVATYCEQKANTNTSFCRQYRQIMKY